MSVQRVELTADQFLKDNVEETNVSLNEGGFNYTFDNGHSWTVIKLEDFNDEAYKEIDEKKIKEEIEMHFEQLLSRNNLTVKIKTRKNQEYICKPFDYSQYSENAYSYDITELEHITNRKTSRRSTIDISDNPIKIRLWLSQNKAIERRPFLVLKGRRIIDISEIKALRSYSKSLTWSHPQAFGFIDATGHLKPLISRNEFENTKESKMVFNAIIKCEDVIKQFVQSRLDRITSSSFSKLEKILNNAVKNLSINDSTDRALISRNGNQQLIGDNQSPLIIDFKNKYSRERVIREISPSNNSDSAENINFDDSSDLKMNHGNNSEGMFRYHNRRRSTNGNISIKIDSETEPIRDSNDRQLRSKQSVDSIIIYKKHPSFEERLEYSRVGIPKINWKLIPYLCNEISYHITCMNQSEGISNNELLMNNIQNYYLLESKISSLYGKNLSELS